MEEQINSEELSPYGRSPEGRKKELEEVRSQRDEYLAGWQRARADFMNHKKEERSRMQEFIKFAGEELLAELLPVIDNLELAQRQLAGKDDTLFKGFLQIAMQLKRFLKDHQVEELKTEGEKFNPEFHEAVEEVEKEGVVPGTVVEVLSKGYALHGKLLRPARVKIAK